MDKGLLSLSSNFNHILLNKIHKVFDIKKVVLFLSIQYKKSNNPPTMPEGALNQIDAVRTFIKVFRLIFFPEGNLS
jgi:hypothetical protein